MTGGDSKEPLHRRPAVPLPLAGEGEYAPVGRCHELTEPKARQGQGHPLSHADA